jgi:hypothetical protein
MNFFNTLASRDTPKEAFRRCDFFDDRWRPFCGGSEGLAQSARLGLEGQSCAGRLAEESRRRLAYELNH